MAFQLLLNLTTEIQLVSGFFVLLIAVFTCFFTMKDDVRNQVENEAISQNFRIGNGRTSLFYGIVVTVATTIPGLLDVVFDNVIGWDSKVGDRREVVMMTLLNLLPGIILLTIEIRDFIFLFYCFHNLQYMGNFAIILSLCHKLAPTYFTAREVIYVEFIMFLCSFFTVLGCMQSVLSPINLVTIILMCFTFAYLLFMIVRMVRNIVQDGRFYDWTLYKENELSCLLYICIFLGVLLMVGLSSASYFMRWVDYDTTELLIWIYGLVISNVSLLIIPTQVSHYLAYKKDLRSVDQNYLRYFSHEIRTPINTVSAGLEVLKNEISRLDNSELTSIILDTISANQVSVDLLNDLQLADKIRAGLLTFKRDTVNGFELILNVLRPFRLKAKLKKINFSIFTSEAAKLVQINVDVGKFSQVIRNLTSNAMNFTPNGGIVSVRVSLVTAETDNGPICKLHIDVIDNGPGVPQVNQEMIFKEYAQFNPGTLQGGGNNGLGLYISKTIMDGMGGELSMTSEGEGLGCTFTAVVDGFSRDATIEMDKVTSPVAAALSDSQSPLLELTADKIGKSDANLLQPFEFGASRDGLVTDFEKEDLDEVRDVLAKLPSSETGFLRSHSTPSWHTSAGVSSLQSMPGAPAARLFPGGRIEKVHPVASFADIDRVSVHLDKQRHSTVDALRRRHTVFGAGLSVNDEPGDELSRGNRRKDANGSTAFKSRGLVSREPKTLLVDDDPLTRKMVKRLLQEFAPGCDVAEDGDVAVEAVLSSLSDGQESFDLVLMDNVMARMNGPVAARAMRDAGYAGLIVGLTGNVMPDQVADYLAHGANFVLGKPLNTSALFDIVTDYMQKTGRSTGRK